jgi:heme-degrading monooxygenase HmoA
VTTTNTTTTTPADPVTLINVFEIPPEEVDVFIAGWTERARIMSTHSGFRDTQLHRALSPQGRFQLVNVAHWDSAESYAAARTDSAFQASRASITRHTPRAMANVELYRVVVAYHRPGGDEPPPVGQSPAT